MSEGQLFRAFKAFDSKLTRKQFKRWYNNPKRLVEQRQRALYRRMDEGSRYQEG